MLSALAGIIHGAIVSISALGSGALVSLTGAGVLVSGIVGFVGGVAGGWAADAWTPVITDDLVHHE